MRKMPIGIQDFEKLRTEEYVYVDKTEYVYELTRLSTPFFLGRPRRFGKSLLLSTLRAYFEGKRELFKGLAMERLEKDWMSHPVLHIDLNVASYGSVADLEEGLDTNLRMFEEEWELDAQSAGQSPSARFHKLIRTAAERSGRKVVVLVDEYDRPLLQTMERSTPTGQRPGSFPSRSFRTRRMGPSDRLQGSQTGIGPQTNKANDDIRAALKGFYGVLKSADRWLRFVLLTGVTKFSKVSVFSDLNMLRDISMEEAYAGVCGITARELADSFGPELAALAENNGMTLDEAMAEMKKRYDGYLFAKRGERMFNPFSVLNTLAKREFDYYWFETGTPTFLIEQMKHEGFDPLRFAEGVTISARSIDDYRMGGGNPVPLLYQSGYLTIASHKNDRYTLDFPNEEVRYGFLEELLPYYTYRPPGGDFFADYFLDDLRAGDADGFMNRMRSFFANIPYDLNEDTERHYHLIFYLVFTLLGQYARAEVHSAKGRADAVVETEDAVYVFEFKLNGTAEEALAQIDEKGYAIPYEAGGRRVVRIGAEFDKGERNIGRWLAEASPD